MYCMMWYTVSWFVRVVVDHAPPYTAVFSGGGGMRGSIVQPRLVCVARYEREKCGPWHCNSVYVSGSFIVAGQFYGCVIIVWKAEILAFGGL